MKITKIESLI